VPTATKIVPCADQPALPDGRLSHLDDFGLSEPPSVSDFFSRSSTRQWFWLVELTEPTWSEEDLADVMGTGIRHNVEYRATVEEVDHKSTRALQLVVYPLAVPTAITHPGVLATGDQLLISVYGANTDRNVTDDPVRLSTAFLLRDDGSVAALSPCALREEDEPNLGGWLDDWLAEVAGSRGQTPAALLLELVADPSLMASLPDRSKVPPSPSTTAKPTSTTAPRPPLPPGSQLVQLDVTVPESWADDESDTAFGVCPRTETGTGMCVLLGPGNGAQFPLRIFTAPGLPIEIVVTDGMRDQDVVAVAGSVVAPADASGRLAVTLTGAPSAPKIVP
jgi:hypothetical protein